MSVCVAVPMVADRSVVITDPCNGASNRGSGRVLTGPRRHPREHGHDFALVMDDREIPRPGFGRQRIPRHAWRKEGDVVPECPLELRAGRLERSARPGSSGPLQCIRYPPPGIPELNRPRIRDPREDLGGWRSPVAEQHRLPHDQHANSRIGVESQGLLECGGPPHASRSGRREKHENSRTIAGVVEFAPKRDGVSRGEARQSSLVTIFADASGKQERGNQAHASDVAVLSPSAHQSPPRMIITAMYTKSVVKSTTPAITLTRTARTVI